LVPELVKEPLAIMTSVVVLQPSALVTTVALAHMSQRDPFTLLAALHPALALIPMPTTENAVI
jgi:hypothetical protein